MTEQQKTTPEVRVDDAVVQRLRDSKRRAEENQLADGTEAGQQWAKDEADADELQRLECLWDQSRDCEWDWFFDAGEEASAYGACERLYFVMHPEDDRRRTPAADFWEAVTGNEAWRAYSGAWVRGFAEGALRVWRDAKDRL